MRLIRAAKLLGYDTPQGWDGGLEGRTMKKAVPVRMPEWPEGHFPTSKQLQTYLFFWERQRKPLEPDPGAGLYQKSFWLDPEDVDVDAYEAECFRGERLDRAQFIRRIIATYHKRTPAPLVAERSRAARELSPAEVNEISRVHGLGICWQPGKRISHGAHCKR